MQMCKRTLQNLSFNNHFLFSFSSIYWFHLEGGKWEMLRGFLVLAFPLLTAPVLSSSQVRLRGFVNFP